MVYFVGKLIVVVVGSVGGSGDTKIEGNEGCG